MNYLNDYLKEDAIDNITDALIDADAISSDITPEEAEALISDEEIIANELEDSPMDEIPDNIEGDFITSDPALNPASDYELDPDEDESYIDGTLVEDEAPLVTREELDSILTPAEEEEAAEELKEDDDFFSTAASDI